MTTKKEKTVFKVEPVNIEKYNRFMELQFLVYEGAILKPAALEELASLDAEIKSSTGRIARKTVNAAIGSNLYKMIAGYPVPESYVQVFRSAGHEDYYLTPQN